MKINSTFILFVLILIAGIACKKDEPIVEPETESCGVDTIDVSTLDTIHANPYLAAYGGSWWQYDISSTTENCIWVNFDILNWVDINAECPTVYKNTVLLPKIENLTHYGDSTISNNPHNQYDPESHLKTVFRHYIDTIPGNTFSVNYGNIISGMEGEGLSYSEC